MAAPGNRPVICSIAFLEILDYSRKSVEEQMRAKAQLHDLLAQALAGVPASERIILDTDGGAAISFIGSPEECLFFALALRDALAARGGDTLRLRVGLNQGPVRLVKDTNGEPNIIGDGISVGQRVMSFAEVNQIVASRAFHDAISALSPHYGDLFSFEGARTDQHVREHELFSLGKAPAPHRKPRKMPGPGAAHAGAAASGIAFAARTAYAQVVRRPPLATALAVALILVFAVGLRQARHATDAAPTSEPVAEVLPEPSKSTTAPSLNEPAPDVAPPPKPQAAHEPPPGVQPREQTVVTGTVRVNVVPWGEVYVNGEKFGDAPPLRDIRLKPGRYRIEIRNPGFASHMQVVDVGTGEEIRIRHRFD